MHDRAVRAGAADGVEGDVAELAGGGAERLELPHHVDLAQPALRRGGVEPGEELGHRRAVAQVRGAGAGDLGGVLAGLGQDAGVALRRPLPPRRRRRAGRRPRPARWPRSTPTRPRSASSRAAKACGGSTVTSGPRWAASAGIGLRGVGEELDPGVGVEDREGERHRACAAMSEPRTLRSQAIESGSVSTEAARSRARRPRASSARLSAALRPASASGCGTIGRAGGAGWSGQTRSIRFSTRHQPDLPRQERRAQRLDLLARCAARGRSRAGRRRAARRRASRRACPRAGASPRRRRDRPGRCTCSR